MTTDFYAILGVPATADFETIRQAYRQQALVNHPDRGGSHEKMVRINEAWNVLSNPVTRAEYDQVRGRGQGAESYHTPAAEKARAEAADYPANWSDFDKWWNGMGADFHQTQFTRNKGGGLTGLMATAETPSGIGFIIGGVVVLWWLMPDGFVFPIRTHSYLKVIFLLTAGSWIGAMAHKITRALFFDAPSPAAAPAADVKTGTSVSFSTASHQAKSVGPKAEVSTAQIDCPKCGQSLRVPELTKAIRITCRSCKHVFQKAPSCIPPPLPAK